MNRLITKHRCGGQIHWPDGPNTKPVITPCGWQPDESARASAQTQIERHLEDTHHAGFSSQSFIEHDETKP